MAEAGVQSFDEKTLAAYNRKNYTVSDVYDLVERLRKRGKAVINIDLVFDEELSEADIESVNELQPETVTLYPNTQGRGSRRLLSVLKTLESAKDRLKNYRPLGSSKFIFVRNDSRQSLYSQTEYELLGNIYGIGHNSVSYVGDTSYLCRYSDGAYELKERHRALNRRFEYLMMGLPSGVKKELVAELLPQIYDERSIGFGDSDSETVIGVFNNLNGKTDCPNMKILIEGIDGSGKDTFAKFLVEELKKRFRYNETSKISVLGEPNSKLTFGVEADVGEGYRIGL